MRVRVIVVVAAVFVGCLSWSAPASAQTTNRAGIEGKIADQSGGVLPGVAVTISSTALQGGARVNVTDAEGRYRFAELPAGDYTVTFTLAGFGTIKRDVRLATGFVATMDEKMAVGGVSESVTVKAESPVVDIRTTGVATNLGKEALEALPTSRSVWQVMNMAPGLRVAGVDVGGSAAGTQQNYSNYGTSSGGNKPLLDGVDTREDAGGAGFYYDYGAFQDVQIKAMGSDAESALPGTQFLGVLKSGSDTFHGSVLLSWESPKLQANNVTDALRARGASLGNPLLSYHDDNFDLGGPILKNRLWFYGSYRNQRIRQGVVGYYTSPGVPGEYNVLITNTTGKLTGQLSTKHRFSGFVQVQKKDYPQRNADGYRYEESTWHQIFKPMAGKGEWSWMVSDHTFLNVFVGRWQVHDRRPEQLRAPSGLRHGDAPVLGPIQHLALRGRSRPLAVRRERVTLPSQRVGRFSQPQGWSRHHRREPHLRCGGDVERRRLSAPVPERRALPDRPLQLPVPHAR